MPVKFVFLWTDCLLYVLLAVVLVSVVIIRKQPHMRRPWQSVFQTKRGAISAMILACFVLIGLLDSIHFRLPLPQPQHTSSNERHYSPEVLSLLDVLVLSLKTQQEKTYSAPLAMYSYVRELQTVNGKPQFITPRLRYGGAHLNSDDQKWPDILHRVVRNTLIAIVIGLCLISAWHVRKKRKVYSEFSQYYPVKTISFVFILILVVSINIADLSQDYHVFGTDKVGQDVLYQILKSIRTGLVIGTLTTLVMLPFALLMGMAAGYFRGWVDDIIQYIYTTLNSIPGVLLIAAAVLMLQVYMNTHPEHFTTLAQRADMRLLFLCIILGLTNWTGLCRLLRGETLKLREAEYVLAAKALGVRSMTILYRHILPNLMHIVMISVVLDFSGLVLAEAVLSYVGVGVDPSMNSWGNMINSARLEMAREPIVWWSLTAAFISMFTLVLSANLFADAVRDAFDPRMKTTR